MMLLRLIFDTNVLISAVLMPRSALARAVRQALRSMTILYSAETLDELQTTLLRAKFDRYVSLKERQEFLSAFMTTAEPIAVTFNVQACRDPRDDKFLALALAGNADCIVTGDEDLLALHPWRSISILSLTAYLALDESR